MKYVEIRFIGAILFLLGLIQILKPAGPFIIFGYKWIPANFIKIDLLKKNTDILSLNEPIDIDVFFCLPASCRDINYIDCPASFDFNNVKLQHVKIFVELPNQSTRYTQDYNILTRCFSKSLQLGHADIAGNWVIVVRVTSVDSNGNTLYFEARKGVEVINPSTREEHIIQKVNIISSIILQIVGIFLIAFPELLRRLLNKLLKSV